MYDAESERTPGEEHTCGLYAVLMQNGPIEPVLARIKARVPHSSHPRPRGMGSGNILAALTDARFSIPNRHLGEEAGAHQGRVLEVFRACSRAGYLADGKPLTIAGNTPYDSPFQYAALTGYYELGLALLAEGGSDAHPRHPTGNIAGAVRPSGLFRRK